jgi:WXG100 family type VII secretion target
VQELGKHVLDVARVFRDALNSAAQDVDSLINGSWRGDAADEFSQGWTTVNDASSKIVATLAGMAEKLGVTAEAYQSSDEARASELTIVSGLDLP